MSGRRLTENSLPSPALSSTVHFSFPPPPQPVMSDTPAHTHNGGKCPVTGASGANPHAFCPPQQGDSRAPCPAMNSMANHGYLPRDGKCVNASMIVSALQKCFKLSKPLAWFLTHGALTLLDQGSGNFELHDLARHNKIEHNASLYHDDAGERDEYAPITFDEDLLELVFKDSAGGVVMTPEDVAKVRVRREATSHPPLDFIHAELARGEIAIVLNMFNNPSPQLHEEGVPLLHRSAVSRLFRRLVGLKDEAQTRQLDGAPIERMKYWFQHERLPEDWKPYHKTTLFETVVTVSRIRSEMHRLERLRKKEAKRISTSASSTTENAELKVEAYSAESAPSVTLQPNEEKVAVESEMSSSRSTSSVDDSPSQTIVAPALHSRDISGSSSTTSSTFPDTPLHTPNPSSGFEDPVPPVIIDGKSGIVDSPPRLEIISEKRGFGEEFDMPSVTVLSV